MNRFTTHVRSNVVGYLALFVALGGTSYAAATLPANSVGPAQLINHSITQVKFNPRYISGSVRAWATVDANGKVLAASTRARGIGPIGVPGNYRVDWAVPASARCTAIASVDETSLGEGSLVPGFAIAQAALPKRSHAMVSVATYSPNGTRTSLPFDVVLLC